jgi:octaprenyl-diphosphate synthase
MLRSKLLHSITNHRDWAKLSAVIELIHLSSLLHDDVIDNADTRRGKVTINKKYSNLHSIMLGDIFYSKAFYELSSFNQTIAKVISSAVTKLSLGELLDVELTNSFNSDIDKYYEMIYLKTSALIEATSEVGAILEGLDTNKYRLFGKNLGIAFQIIDDILDIVSDSKTLGKPAFSDFKEGKTTLPFIFLYQDLDSSDKNRLLSLFKKDLDSSESAWIKEKMKQYHSIEKSKEVVLKLAKEAKEAVNNQKLELIIDNMINRDF